MTWIGVDIDDTLTSFQETAREMFVEMAVESGDKRLHRGAYCSWGEWRSPADVTNDDIWPRVIERCHSPENIARQSPFPNAASTLRRLMVEGYRLHYISNRNPEVLEPTRAWLRDHSFPMVDEVTRLTCNYDDKLPQLIECQYLIDDRPKTLVQFVYDFHWKHKHGSENHDSARKGFGLYMPYNAALTDVPGIKLAPNWKLLRQYLIDTEVLRRDTRVALIH